LGERTIENVPRLASEFEPRKKSIESREVCASTVVVKCSGEATLLDYVGPKACNVNSCTIRPRPIKAITTQPVLALFTLLLLRSKEVWACEQLMSTHEFV